MGVLRKDGAVFLLTREKYGFKKNMVGKMEHFGLLFDKNIRYFWGVHPFVKILVCNLFFIFFFAVHPPGK